MSKLNPRSGIPLEHNGVATGLSENLKIWVCFDLSLSEALQNREASKLEVKLFIARRISPNKLYKIEASDMVGKLSFVQSNQYRQAVWKRKASNLEGNIFLLSPQSIQRGYTKESGLQSGGQAFVSQINTEAMQTIIDVNIEVKLSFANIVNTQDLYKRERLTTSTMANSSIYRINTEKAIQRIDILDF